MEIKYRPEIDGIRAIAVLSVIIYHADLTLHGSTLLPGGFFGVDIFFVISGFLITSLMMKELDRTSTISIMDFYKRRARRLLPALLLVMLASLPFAYYYLIPDQLIDFSKSLISSIFFGSNFYWNYSLQQYGVESGIFKPFLHTWSLAIEEQYYILFPLILLFSYKFFKEKIGVILLIGLLASFLYAEFASTKDASFSFYMLPSRIWELLAGALLAKVIYRNPQRLGHDILNKLMPSMGLALILYSFIFINLSDNNHPGYITFIPVLGTIFIIYFSNRDEIVTKLLSLRLVVGIGLISYALYLWHYPVLSFLTIHLEDPSATEKLLSVGLTFALSLSSYFLIEKPFRNKKTISTRIFISTTGLSALLVISLSILWTTNKGEPERFGYVSGLISAVEPIEVIQGDRLCHSSILRGDIRKASELCIFNKADNKENVFILIGDSHAGHLAHHTKRLSESNGYDFIQMTQDGCRHVGAIRPTKNEAFACAQRDVSAVKSILAKYPEAFLIYSTRMLKDKKEEEFKHISKILTEYAELVKKLVIVYSPPELDFNVTKKLMKHGRHVTIAEDLPTLSVSYEDFRKSANDYYSSLDKVEGDNVIRIFPEDALCLKDESRCIASTGDRIYYEDKHHLSLLGTSNIVTMISKKLDVKPQ